MPQCLFSNKKGLIIVVSLIGLSASLSTGQGPVSANGFGVVGRPNILWLTSEDHSAYWLGSFGNKNAHTPNLDGLAEHGIRYTNFFANAPVCAVARTSLILGTYAPHLGLQHMRSGYEIPDYIRTYSEVLQDAGYYVTNRSKDDFNFPYDKNQVWSDVGLQAHYRNRPYGSSFFCIFNSTTTHESSLFPTKYKRYRDEGIIPETTRVDFADVVLPTYLPDLPAIREDHAIYHDVMTAMDKEVGKLLADLEADGEADNTIIFYFSDHGGVIPRAKRYLQDTGTNVPLIVYFPEKWKHLAPAGPGSVIDDPVSFIDLPPTVLNLAGAEVPGHMHGTPIFGTDSSRGPRSLVFLYGHRFDGQMLKFERGLTDGHFRYIRNFHPFRPQCYPHGYTHGQAAWQTWYAAFKAGETNAVQSSYWERNQPVDALFHTDTDRWEVKNMAGDPAYAERLEFMKQSLIRQMTEIRDIGIIPEGMWHDLMGEGTIYEYVNRPDFPYEDLLNLAFKATDGSMASFARYQVALASDNPIERYWGLVGCTILGSEAKPALLAIRRLTKDEMLINRVAAYTALSQMGWKKFAVKGILELLNGPVTNMAFTDAIDTLVGLGEENQITDAQLQSIQDKVAAIKPSNRSMSLVAQAADTLLKARNL
ncbi:MAG: sulfatase [Opitutaceae bacterium]|nr:sulfatase [Opitutaceae bacterium]